MALPRALTEVFGSITPQTDAERRLLRALQKRLESSLGIIEKAFGHECAADCFRYMVDDLFAERSTTVLDKYESWVERCARQEVGRPLTESEEELLGEVLGHITGIVETLLNLAGLELEDPEDEEDEAAQSPKP